MKLIAFCESPSDFLMLSTLVDRVLQAKGPVWVAESIESFPDAVRTWRRDLDGQPFVDVHGYKKLARRLDLRMPHGHFDGKPGAAGALMARTLFRIVRQMNRERESEPIEGVVLVWDSDGDGARRIGVDQARVEAHRLESFRIAIGLPNEAREAWVLAGFRPAGPAEESLLADLRSELGFCPLAQSARLRHEDDGPRSGKRVLRVLTSGDADREERCWTDTPLQTLRDRGEQNGLRDFLDEIEQYLVPLLSRSA